MLIFEELSIKNFLSFGNIPTVFKLNTHKKTLICGENGSGKTTIINALSFVLFGKTARKANLPQLLNTINNKDCLVEVKFQSGVNNYLVKRGLKPNLFEIYINDFTKPIEQTDKKDYQKYFEDYILKTDYKTFISVVMIGGKNYSSFLNQPKADRRHLIESLLDIDIFSLMNKVSKEKIDEIDQQNKTYNDNISSYNKEIELIKNSIEKIKSILYRNKEEENEKINNIECYINNIDNEIQLINNNIDNIYKQFGNIELVENQFNKKRTELLQLESNYNKELVELNKNNQFYSNNNSCPTCKQDINNDIKDKVINTNNNTINYIQKKRTKLQSSLLELDSLYKEIKESLLLYNKYIQEKDKLLYSKNNYLNVLSELKKSFDENKNQTELIELENSLVNKLEELNKITLEFISIKEEYDYYNFCLSLLKDDGIKSLIIKEYLPQINTLINLYLEQLDLFIGFEFDEFFNETIKSRYRDTFSYESFSDGQKMKIDIALLFTWREISQRKNSLNLNILFCDELFDQSLDPASTELAIKLLNVLPQDISCFIISHKAELFENRVDRIWKAELLNNFSLIHEIC